MPAEPLGPDQSVEGRPFTSPNLYQRDIQVLGYMVEDLRGLIGELYAGIATIKPYEPVMWRVHGLGRRTVICDPMRLGERRDVCVVGFFGERRHGIDATPLEAADTAVLLEFKDYPGILAYSSMQLTQANWANLVLHTAPEDREAWRRGEQHARAVAELAPIHYNTVRIHNGMLPGGLSADTMIEIDRTKYWDYQDAEPWHGVRELGARTRE